MSANPVDEAAQYLPGLSLESRIRLYEDLQRLGEINYYWITEDQGRYQGDVVRDSRFIGFEGHLPQLDRARSMILSNSCDIDPDNARQTPRYITIAPLMRVSRFGDMLAEANIDAGRIAQKIEAIRAQQVTTMFFLPSGGEVAEDSLVLFDQLQSVPIDTFESWHPAPLGKLSQAAHWLLLLKLSVHFSRLYDETDRYASELQPVAGPAA